ncbi:cell division protein FtsZ [Bacteroidota bacterium]
MAKEMNFNLPKEEGSIIKVIGVGGGGSNAVNHMYKQGIRGVDFVVCNTDQQALDMSPVPKKIALGSSLTEGRGAGAQAEVGRNAAIETLDDIREVLENNTKMVFITAGMGGGTGTGAAPVIAEAARELGILTVGIVTIPFNFEGRKRKLQADKGLEELKKHVDTVLIISNDKLREMYGNLKLSEAFNQADDVLSIAAKGIAEIITVEGYVNVDFEDVRTVMTKSGVAIMGSATASGEDRAIKAVHQALASPLLNDNNIYGASNILLYISSGVKDEVTMDEVSEITDYIQEEAGLEADVIWGNGSDDELGDKLSITIIATGFSGEKLEKVEGTESRKVYNLDTKTRAAVDSTAPKRQIPAGLTSPPTLINRNLSTVSETKNPPSALFHEPTVETATMDETEEPIIKHELEEEVLEEKKPQLMGYMVDETDDELNELINKEAPEMIGTPVGEKLPEFSYEEDDEELDFIEETPTEATPIAEAPKQTGLLNFSMNLQTEEETFEKVDEVKEEQEVDAITKETPTEFEFVISEKTEVDEIKTTFDLYEDEPEAPTAEEKPKLDNEPKLITRPNHVETCFDTEDMQKRQQERMERLRSKTIRFSSPSSLAELENVPAFKRRQVNLIDPPHSSESSVSRFQLKVEDDSDENGNRKSGLSDRNPFLHESVD